MSQNTTDNQKIEEDFFYGSKISHRAKQKLFRRMRQKVQMKKKKIVCKQDDNYSIASFSDFHLGLRNGIREFQGNEDEACSFIDFMEAEYNTNLILGDFYGIIENKGKIDLIRHRYPRLSERIESFQYKIFGNHDNKVKENYLYHPWQASYVDNYKGKNFQAIHGHQFDRYNKNAERGLGARLARGHSFWENRIRRNMKRIKDRYKLPDQVSTIFQLIRILTFEYNIEQYAELYGFDIILSGHIHYPTVKKFPSGVVYINNGSCLDRYMFSHIQPNIDKYEIREWHPKTQQVTIVRTMEDARYSQWIASIAQSGLFS